MQLKSPLSNLEASLFPQQHSFLKNIFNSLLYSLRTHNIWKRSLGKYKSYGTWRKTTHEAGVVQQCTEAQAGVVRDGLKEEDGQSSQMPGQNW